MHDMLSCSHPPPSISVGLKCYHFWYEYMVCINVKMQMQILIMLEEFRLKEKEFHHFVSSSSASRICCLGNFRSFVRSCAAICSWSLLKIQNRAVSENSDVRTTRRWKCAAKCTTENVFTSLAFVRITVRYTPVRAIIPSQNFHAEINERKVYVRAGGGYTSSLHPVKITNWKCNVILRQCVCVWVRTTGCVAGCVCNVHGWICLYVFVWPENGTRKIKLQQKRRWNILLMLCCVHYPTIYVSRRVWGIQRNRNSYRCRHFGFAVSS